MWTSTDNLGNSVLRPTNARNRSRSLEYLDFETVPAPGKGSGTGEEERRDFQFRKFQFRSKNYHDTETSRIEGELLDQVQLVDGYSYI